VNADVVGSAIDGDRRLEAAAACGDVLERLGSPGVEAARAVLDALRNGIDPDPAHVEAVARALACLWAERVGSGGGGPWPSADVLRFLFKRIEELLPASPGGRGA
jgi:hypothetical protein